jgi:serine/threonine protein kinase/CHASE2 domain-containing sensor protein
VSEYSPTGPSSADRTTEGASGGAPFAGGPMLGEFVGPYKLLSILGEGGFGVVYLAERREPMVQRVALKIVKPGMDSAVVIARFEQERQALAVLDHPNIAKVFDAGTTPRDMGSRPYFVMEYVGGETITEYCDRRKLGIEERLGLFGQLCDAVSHAHARAIVHRDLKPSNVLVHEIDETPVAGAVVKVIDFGVAKALASPLTRSTLHTETGTVIGTPEYMAPEQASAGGRDAPSTIDQRTDVYSLGVVLYELLCGRLPFDPAALRRVSFDEARRLICRVDPPTPSARFRGLERPEQERIAATRSIGPDELELRLRRDLDDIPAMALRKEPSRRYPSARAMGDDVRRALEGRPLKAGPDSLSYRLRTTAVRRLGRRGSVVAAWAACTLAGVAGAALVPAPSLGVLVQRARLALFELRLESPALERVRIVRITDRTDIAALTRSQFITGDPAELHTKRLLHARLLERLSRADVASVTFDIYFAKASEFDDFLGGKAELRPKADVVFGTATWGGSWVAERRPARDVRVGAMAINLTPTGDADVALAAFARSGGAGLPSLSLQAFAATLAPANPASVRRFGEDRLQLDLGTPGTSPVLMLTSGVVELPKDELGASKGDSIAYFPVFVPPNPAIDAACTDYAEAFTLAPEELRARFAGKAVVIADATDTADTHAYSDGRRIGGYAIQAQGIDQLLRVFGWRQIPWADAALVAAACGVGALLAGVATRRTTRVVGWVLAGAALLAAPILILQVFMVLVHAAAGPIGMLATAGVVRWLRPESSTPSVHR